MWTGRFDPSQGIIWIRAHISGPSGERYLKCILDTGTPRTIVDTSILDALGYGAQMGTRIFEISGIGGSLPSYELPLIGFEAMGRNLERFPVLSQDIVPDDMGVDGLIGMDLITGHVLTIDARSGTVTLAH
jgi:hypothetical protein